MRTVRTLTILLLFGLTTLSVLGQENRIYQLETNLMKGDKNALFEIANHFDSNKKVIEYLGYHRLETVESEIAKRIVSENCLFTESEIRITNSTSTKQFSNFLTFNKDKITFSKLANAFLITPLDKRKVNFEIRDISQTKRKELQDRAKELLSPDWVKQNKIDSLIEHKNPISLLIIASELFKERSRFNRYYFNEEEFTDLLEFLTGTEIAVENESKKLSWHIDKDYYPDSKLNLLIYFSNFYTQYSWNERESVFTNPNNKIKPLGKEELLFELLSNKNDSIAIDAFTQLTICNPTKVVQLADEYARANIDANCAIPIFPYKFLEQMVVLTEYCRNNNIDYIGSTELRNNINLLQANLTFAERYKLENKLINSLSLDDITAFEYWALIHEESFSMSYSAGRILDIFYSTNWNKLLENRKQLACYFKKAKLFDQLGIIGICNNYLRKFSNSSPSTLELLNKYQTSDSDIKEQIYKIVSSDGIKIQKQVKRRKEWDGNKDYTVTDLENKLITLTTQVQDSAKSQRELVELLSKISYNQIGIALKCIEDFPFKYAWETYSFMERDWGFFMVGDFDNKETRQEFIELYSKLSEYDLYSYYLDQAGINYKNSDNSLNYDKIYELIKYDVVVAFVGGGGGTKDNEVYSLIKLLELTFKTTLGFPHKLCNSNGMYGCDSDERVKAWMKYFEDKKLLKLKHDEPISYHYE